MSKQKSALGRGLGALLPSSEEEEAAAGAPGIESTRLYNFDERMRAANTIAEVEVARVSSNPFQPRTHFDESALQELASSIRELGIIQPITVRKRGADRYELISGERRLKAASLAGLMVVPAYIREADSEAMLEMAIVENVQREQLNPIEIALGYQRLIDECSLTQEQVAVKIGKNRSTIANFLRLLKLPAVIQAGLRDGLLTTGHARAMLPLENEDQQRSLLEEIHSNGLSVREVEQRVKAMLAPTKPKKKVTKSKEAVVSVEMKALSDRMQRAAGTKVRIKPSSTGKGGRVEVEYYSDDDLGRLVDFFENNG